MLQLAPCCRGEGTRRRAFFKLGVLVGCCEILRFRTIGIVQIRTTSLFKKCIRNAISRGLSSESSPRTLQSLHGIDWSIFVTIPEFPKFLWNSRIPGNSGIPGISHEFVCLSISTEFRRNLFSEFDILGPRYRYACTTRKSESLE